MEEVLGTWPQAQSDWLARLRIRITYAFRHRRLPNLELPRLYTELVQHRKLSDRDPMLPRLADKLLAKDHVARVLGPEWVTPTLWHGAVLPARRTWSQPIVIKSRHGCKQHIFARDPDHDWDDVRRRSARWMRRPYGFWLDEWLYSRIERGLLIEPFIGEGDDLPIDYKLHLFAGRVEYVQVHLDREGAHRWLLFDRNWRRLSNAAEADPPPPRSLDAMIDAAEALGRRYDHVRIDFYDLAGTPRFGEMTFYPGSGLDRFDPPTLDAQLGANWLAARR